MGCRMSISDQRLSHPPPRTITASDDETEGVALSDQRCRIICCFASSKRSRCRPVTASRRATNAPVRHRVPVLTQTRKRSTNGARTPHHRACTAAPSLSMEKDWRKQETTRTSFDLHTQRATPQPHGE
ncbi:hypothetical protein C8Q74DRAFT_1005554 [Fomes fomentarius]|nr:hypothetical protein C8Q74DRAFT_1005554 [Fomes fomentarius]